MRRPAFLAAILALALLVVAAPAQGKQITRAEVCGAGGCANRTSLARDERIFEAGEPADAPARQPFVRVVVHVGEPGGGEGGRWSLLYLPRAALVRSTSEDGTALWTRPGPMAAARLKRMARGVRPFAATRLPHDPPPPRSEPVAVAQPARAAAAGDDGDGDGGPPVSAAIAAGGLLALGAGAMLRRRRRP